MLFIMQNKYMGSKHLLFLQRGSSGALGSLLRSSSSLLSDSGGLTSLALQDLLDDLLFLNKEGADDAVADTQSATGSTIGTGDRLATLGELAQLAGSDGGELDRY